MNLESLIKDLRFKIKIETNFIEILKHICNEENNLKEKF